ncbi:MAG: tyrosine-type recombinase/integrase, partial [Candidatus Entotheonellia bacterium]
ARPATWARRLSSVRGFAHDRSATDARTEVPPWGLLPHRPQRARPYLYTDTEIQPWLEAALHLVPAGGLRAWTYHALLGLLAVTGLRIREAPGLTREDVDVQAGVLTVRGTTFGKSRLVPLHASTQQVLAAYTCRRDACLAGRRAVSFFVSRRGTRLDGATVRRTLYTLSRQMGLRGPGASRGPRLHDFRHRVAVQTLVQWYRAGEEVGPRLPIVSTYLGHVQVSDTYWYLTACPELMGLAVKRLEPRWEVRS